MEAPDGLQVLRDEVALIIKRSVALAVEAEREACIQIADDVLFDRGDVEEVVRRIRDRKYRP